MTCKAPAQQIDSAFFRNPIDFPISLSGNFGELRNNHFHSGIDIRTNGEEGKAIYAVADGYVSRIKVSAFGYGNALYVTHKNGKVSVYGHLSAYNKNITEYLRAEQYKQESFEVDLFPAKSMLSVLKGDTIALSGNTGGSEAPHLHFEIRDEKTEWTQNPLLHGFSISDTVKPEIYNVVFYPRNLNSVINGTNEKQSFGTKNIKGIVTLNTINTLQFSGLIGFGVETNDEESDHGGRNGTYNIQLFVDEIMQYDYKISSFAFEQTRNINAHIDFQQKKKSGKYIQKCFVEPNNKLHCYTVNKNSGAFNFNDDSIHKVKIVVSDVYNNATTLTFDVKSQKNTLTQKPLKTAAAQDFFYYNIENNFKRDGAIIRVPIGAIQNDINFEFSSQNNPNFLSPIYKVHRDDEPLLLPYQLKIKLPKNISPKLYSKLLIASLNGNNNLTSEGGAFNEITKSVEANLKTFGNFVIAVDTIKPTISNVIVDNSNAITRNIVAKISDNLSGIKSYRGTIDNNWILMEYDYKNARLVYTFDEKYNDDKPHKFMLKVTDYKGNSREFVKQF